LQRHGPGAAAVAAAAAYAPAPAPAPPPEARSKKNRKAFLDPYKNQINPGLKHQKPEDFMSF
jgi:hypothetical protein